MELESLKKKVMFQAKAKGFGTSVKEISVAEKLVLIHSEISESYSAYLRGNLAGREGFYEETGDALQRVLHLGGIFKVNFSRPPRVNFKKFKALTREGKIAWLHLIASRAWENYRRGRLKKFKDSLVELAFFIVQFAADNHFSLKTAINKKLVLNLDRDWRKENKPNEKFIS